jgi:DNA transformation protein
MAMPDVETPKPARKAAVITKPGPLVEAAGRAWGRIQRLQVPPITMMLAPMPLRRDFLDHIADQLRSFGPVTVRRMFGGAGLYHGERMFGLVADDVLYFKVDDASRADYLAAGAKPFTYRRRLGRATLPTYYEVPASILDDADTLADWARAALAATEASRRAKAARAVSRAKAKPRRPPRKRAPKAQTRRRS